MVDFVGLAFEEEAAGEVPKAVDGRMSGGADDAGGGLGFGTAEALVDAGDDDVELVEEVVGEIEGAVFEDVNFDAGEEVEV